MSTKVQISIPCLDMVPVEFALSLAALVATNTIDRRRDKRPVDISIAHCQGSLVMDSRNTLVEKALSNGASHVFFLDSDVVVPPNCLNILIGHHKHIVGATYVKRYPPHEILGNALPGGVPLGNLHPMATLPFGCVLIKCEVFERLPRPWFKYLQGDTPFNTQSEDTYFCNRAREAGHTIYLDRMLSQSVGHVGTKVFRPVDTQTLPLVTTTSNPLRR